MLKRNFWRLVAGVGLVTLAFGAWFLLKLGFGVFEKVFPGPQPPPIAISQKNAAPSENALVFVHGFLSNPDDGFTGPGGRSWLDVVAADTRENPISGAPPLSTFSTYVIDYRRVFASRSSIEDAAGQVQNVILSTPFEDGLTLLQRHNNIWFVAHSLGGVVMKRVLIRMNDTRYDRGLRRVKGIFLLGVPSNGAPAAGLADYPAVETISRFYADMDVIRGLDPEKAAAFIGATETAWTNFVERRRDRFYVGCAYEKSPDLRHVNWNLVEQLYSNTRCTRHPESFPYDHFGLVKIEDRMHDVHLWLRHRIEESWSNAQLWPYISVDTRGKTLGQWLGEAKKAGSVLEPDTRISDVPEIVSFSDEKTEALAGALGLGAVTYTGPTLANVIEHIARENACIGLSLDEYRRKVTISINGDVAACRKAGTKVEYVCSNVAC